MAIGQYDLKRAAARNYALNQRTKGYWQKTGFLCHSHKDREMALGLQQWLKEHGLDLYIDWQDASMPETPDGTTAGRIRTMIRNADVFLFLATSDSLTSRWCPWRSEEHTSELQSIMRISYAVFCLNKKKIETE